MTPAAVQAIGVRPLGVSVVRALELGILMRKGRFTTETDLARFFEGSGLPAYILIDRDSKVAAMQPGSGGLLALREMLKEVDLRK